MTWNVKLERRDLLIAGGVAGAGMAAYCAAGIVGVAMRCGEFASESEAAAQSIVRIGLAYLRVHPEEASEARLIPAVAGRFVPIRALNAVAGGGAVFPLMDDLVRADFAAGEIVKCDGWILAKSEARVCALFALQNGRSPDHE